MVFRVDFWDVVDGWGFAGYGVDTDPSREFESKEDAIKLCQELQMKTPPSSMGDHYGVIDLDIGKEVFCGKAWYFLWESKRRKPSGVLQEE